MQKFIVTADGLLRFGNVNMHRDLLHGNESCIGGGTYEFDYTSGRMLLSGKSYDFGRVKWALVDHLVIPAGLRGISILYEDLPIEDFAPTVYE